MAKTAATAKKKKAPARGKWEATLLHMRALKARVKKLEDRVLEVEVRITQVHGS